MWAALPFDEPLKELFLDLASSSRGIKAVKDKRRPRVIDGGSAKASGSLSKDYAEIVKLIQDDEPCLLVIRVDDADRTVPKVNPNDVVLISWSPQSMNEKGRHEWDATSTSLVNSLSSSLRVKQLHARVKGDLTWDNFRAKCEEFAMLDYMASCYCGALELRVKGKPLGSEICHSQASCRASGTYPVHMVRVRKEDTSMVKGEEVSKVAEGSTSFKTVFCTLCGGVFYRDEGDVLALFPTTFHIEDIRGVECKLPELLRPQCHVHYQNRQWDWNDDLPKFKTTAGGPQLTGTGEAIV